MTKQPSKTLHALAEELRQHEASVASARQLAEKARHEAGNYEANGFLEKAAEYHETASSHLANAHNIEEAITSIRAEIVKLEKRAARLHDSIAQRERELMGIIGAARESS